MVVRFVTLGATTMRRLIPFLLGMLLLLNPGNVPAAHGQDAKPPSSSLLWVSLGPVGPFPVTAVGVSPNWPEDRFILAARKIDLVRSFDGGTTWERLPLPD